MRGWPTAGVLAILLTSAVTACTGGVQPAQQARQAPLLSSPAPQHGEQALGASGCYPASPISRWQSFLPQVEGTGRDKPGDEWGAGYVFNTPGCWDLRAIRGDAIADAWIQVVTRLSSALPREIARSPA